MGSASKVGHTPSISAIAGFVGLYPDSKSRRHARRSSLEVLDTSRATKRGDVIFLALPDSAMPRIYAEQVAAHLRAGQTLLFAHGFAIYYRPSSPEETSTSSWSRRKAWGQWYVASFLEGVVRPV